MVWVSVCRFGAASVSRQICCAFVSEGESNRDKDRLIVNCCCNCCFVVVVFVIVFVVAGVVGRKASKMRAKAMAKAKAAKKSEEKEGRSWRYTTKKILLLLQVINRK